MINRKHTLIGATLLFFLTSVPFAQDTTEDRWQWIDENTTVTDDPRRIPIAPGPQGPDGVIVLQGGRVFTATGDPARKANLVIERNRIKAILSPELSDWPDGSNIIDISGKTVIPGLIDLHVHMTQEDNLVGPWSPGFIPGVDVASANTEADYTLVAAERMRYYIESGITSIRDLSSHGLIPFRIKEWSKRNRIPSPRVFSAGQFITSTGGHGAEQRFGHDPDFDPTRIVNGPDEWRQAVREQFNKGADLIKLGSHFSREEVKAAIDEAHALGLKVTVDSESFYTQWAVEAGADVIEHPLPRTDETISLMAKKGVGSDPTLIPYHYIIDRAGGYYSTTSRRFTLTKESMMTMLRKLKEAQITMGIGTDIWPGMHRFQPIPYIGELKLFVAAGFSIPEALMAATKNGAQLLDMGDLLGTIEPNKLADVVVIDGQPDKNLDDLMKVDLVIKDGRIIVRGGRVNIPRHVPPETM